MGRCRVVEPKLERLPLSDGDFIDVKQRLNAGEYRQVIADTAGPTLIGDRITLDVDKVGLTKIVQYLVGWSLIGLDGKPIPYGPDLPDNVRVSALLAQDPETFMEILNAIDAHEAREDQARAQEKKLRAGVSGSSATSPSPSDATGPSSTSVN